MARFIADEIIRLRPEPSGPADGTPCGGASNGKRERGTPACGSKLPLSRAGLEAACMVFLGKLKQIEKGIITYKKMDPRDKINMEKSMEAALKAYLRVARKNAE